MQTQSYGRFRERISNLLLSMAPEQHMEGEGAAVGGGGVLKGGYDVLGFVNCLYDPSPRISYAGGIVCLLALPLHKNKSSPKGLDFRRKGTHRGLVVALVSGVPVFQCPVGLYPSRSASAGAGQPVGAAMGQGVEQRVVGGTDGAPQFGLAGPAPVSARRAGRQLPGDSYQVVRVHWLCPGILSLKIFFHSDFSMNAWPGPGGHSS